MATEEILESWEELDDNEVLDKKLSGIKVAKTKMPNRSPAEVSVLQEFGERTQYTPRVRILKRQPDPSAATQQQKAPTVVQKTLQQREAEYNEARLRIMGENYTSAPPSNMNSCTEIPAETKPIKLVKSMEDLKLEKPDNKVTVLRQPRGPDGSAGFQLR